MRLRLVPGFSLTMRSWEPLEHALPLDWDVQALEVPDGLDFVATADTLAHRGGAGSWVGYSMGARLALRLALDRPGVVDRLALLSGTAGIPSPADRQSRRDHDEQLARDVERDGVALFLERWLEQRLFETLPRNAAQLDDPAPWVHRGAAGAPAAARWGRECRTRSGTVSHRSRCRCW